jgi:hypothetical protein
MAAERMRQSMESLSMLLSLKAVSMRKKKSIARKLSNLVEGYEFGRVVLGVGILVVRRTL